MFLILFMAPSLFAGMGPSVDIAPCIETLELTPFQKDTLAIYDNTAQRYVENTQAMDVSADRNKFLEYVPRGGLILDVGSGSGRDSLAFLETGYRVEAIDGSAGLAELASKKIGQPVRVLLFEQIDYVETFDGIFAYFSLIHLPPAHLVNVMNRLYRALKPGQVLYMRMSYGEKEFEKDGRYFNAFTETSLREFIETNTPFEIAEIDKPLAKLVTGQQAYSVEAILRRPLN
jgi:SAM-dependent methyltransferase